MAGLSRICSLEHVIDRHSTGRGFIRTWSHRLERRVRTYGQRSDADLQKKTPLNLIGLPTRDEQVELSLTRPRQQKSGRAS